MGPIVRLSIRKSYLPCTLSRNSRGGGLQRPRGYRSLLFARAHPNVAHIIPKASEIAGRCVTIVVNNLVGTPHTSRRPNPVIVVDPFVVIQLLPSDSVVGTLLILHVAVSNTPYVCVLLRVYGIILLLQVTVIKP